MVLATVCGHVADSGTYDLTHEEFARAIELLAPAEACTDVDHPNLWSWRPLLEGATDTSRFVAIFVRDATDGTVAEVLAR